MSNGKERKATDEEGWSITQDDEGTVRIRDEQGWLHAVFKYKHIENDENCRALLQLWKYISGELGAKIDDEIARLMRS